MNIQYSLSWRCSQESNSKYQSIQIGKIVVSEPTMRTGSEIGKMHVTSMENPKLGIRVLRLKLDNLTFFLTFIALLCLVNGSRMAPGAGQKDAREGRSGAGPSRTRGSITYRGEFRQSSEFAQYDFLREFF